MTQGFPRKDFTEFVEIGRGGQGEVYRVKQLSLDRHVVMKFLHFDDSAELEAAADTIKKLSALTIANIPGILRTDRKKHRLTVVMDWIQGLPLSGLSTDSWSLPMRLLAAADICAVIADIHRAGWSHGDLKPDNILLDRLGNSKIIDLGFARQRFSQSQPADIRGTRRYLPPESVLNQKTDPIRADLFSLGMILYELLSGRELQRSRLSGIQAQPMDAIPEQVNRIIIQCLAVSPDKRPASASDVGRVIRQAAGVFGEEVRSLLAAECDTGFRTDMAQLCIRAARAKIKSHRNQAYGLLREALTMDTSNTEALSLLEGFPTPSVLSVITWKKLAVPAVFITVCLGAALWYFNTRPLSLPSAAEMLDRGPGQALAKKPKAGSPKPLPPAFQLREKQTAVSGRLSISGLPPDAQLSLDGKPRAAEGPSTTIPVRSGLRVLTLTRNSKIIWTDSVHVPPHAQIKVHVSLE